MHRHFNRVLTTMTNRRDQLDVPGKDSPDTSQQPPRKDGKFRNFFSIFRSVPTRSSVASQVDSQQNKPLPQAPAENRLLTDVFPENVAKPAVKTTLPGLQDRIERTNQLLYCNTLFLQESSSLSSTTEEPTCNQKEQKWLAEIKEDPIGQDHIQWLVIMMVEAFIAETTKDSTKIAEITALGPVMQREPYRKLLSSFIHDFDEARILDVNLLEGLVQLVQTSSAGFLVSDDLVKVLSLLRIYLQGKHQQSSEHPYHLTLAVSRILDVMADHKVQDLGRILEHEPLSAVLSGLKDSFDPYLMYQACYAFQALLYVPDDDTVLQAVLRHSTGVGDGLIKVTSVLKLDMGSVLEGLEKLQEVAVSVIGIASTVYEGVGSLRESGRGVLESLKEGFGSGQKKPWYPAVRAAYAFVQSGQLKNLKQLIVGAPCRQDPLFQWGICQLLGEIAGDTVWAIATRQQAIVLLGHLYKDDLEWGRDESVKTWMLTILGTLGSSSDDAINEHASALLQDLGSDNTPRIQHPYPLRSRLPIPESSPILAKVQGIPYMEYELYKLRMERLKDAKQPIYISPMAKASLQAQDNEVFPLMDKLQEFLASDRQVMLILGDSGAGKSTFNRHLERHLWIDYKRGGPIPVFINLATINEPKYDMVTKQLQSNNFNDDQIQELKLHRQLVLICDGYDESQQQVNLHSTNFLNQPGQWNTKMVITCRTQYLGPSYHDRFKPQPLDRYNTRHQDLFQEAVIALFSNEQIKNYVDQFVQDTNTQQLLGIATVWSSEEYMDKLTAIRNLLDLVRNPFLLTIALNVLPKLVATQQDLLSLRVTRVGLYDKFVEHWLEINKLRLQSNTLSNEERDVFGMLLDAGFVEHGIDFQKRLSDSIFKEQDGHLVVQYTHLHHRRTWKAEFFSPDPDIRLMRESCPLTRTGSQFRFVHRSVLEYFLSCVVYSPDSTKREFDPQGSPDSTAASTLDANSPLFTRNLLKESSVIQFLSDRVNENACFKQQLLSVVKLSKSDVLAATAAANAITILVRAGVSFNGADLQGIRIPGADLTGGHFDSAQLQDADLTGVNLSRAWMRQADLSRAGMDGTQFGELPCLEELEMVSSCAFSPDGKLLAAGLWKGNISIYDTATWTKIQVFQGHQKAVTSLAYSPNSQQLLSGSNDKTARLWNSETGSTDLIMEGHSLDAMAVAFSPTGQQVATASYDTSLRLWDARTGDSVFVSTDSAGIAPNIAYSPGGNTIASTNCDNNIRVLDTLTGLPVLVSCQGDDVYRRLTYSHDGGWIAAGTSGGRLELWEVTATTLGPRQAWTAHTSGITSIAFSPDDRWIASSSFEHTVKLWDSRSGSLVSSFINHVDKVNCVRFSPNGSYIASASHDRTLQLWEVNSLKTGFGSPDTAYPQFCATYSRDGRQLITGSRGAPMRQFNADSGDVDFVFPDHLHNIVRIAFSPDGLQIAIGSGQQEVTLWSVESRAASFVLSGHKSGVNCVAFSPCGRWLASGSNDGTVRLWDTRSGAAGHVLNGQAGWAQSVAFSPDGCWIASTCMQGKVLLWEAGTGELKAETTIDAGRNRWNFVVYKPGYLQVASCHRDGDIRLWDGDQQLQGFRYILKQDREIYQFAFSSCGQWLATAHSASVRLWRLPSPDQEQEALPLQDQDCVSVIEGFTGVVSDVVWRPNKLEFSTASYEGSIRTWRVVEDSNGSGRVSIRLSWSSGPVVLAASCAVLDDTVGLSVINRRLLEQRGATGFLAN
ncbi:hypothetical protein KI688_003999 [Linnemannia hyalina]|uniref:WD40 repeat-like protein n=1 Tax=Linnemannia hyalina TaxID=64524 RepID=A0A9P7XM85_9FUNG|nr:hypothetical protein KI688_003999 [Linnemannia hyalina]